VTEVRRLADAAGVASAAAHLIRTTITAAKAERGRASVVLTGGGVGTRSVTDWAAGLRAPAEDLVDVHLWWGDERFVPADDPERNDKALLDALPAAAQNPTVHRMGAEGDTADAEAAASAYARELDAFAAPGEPLFDLLLLGVGPDGHVASLFPHHPALAERSASVVVVPDSPKPPPTRLSMSIDTLNRARQVWFLVAGADKADAVARAFGGASYADIPATGVHGLESTGWLLDEAAGASLP
jgi:6-phosphogluconolactonase